MDASPPAHTQPPLERWWKEPGLWALVLLVLLVYFTRLDVLPVRHEEPHRGQVGLEMLQSGDWIVPRRQGVPALSRPPLQNWAIAGLVVLRGGMDEVAIRLPSALGVLATVVLLYGYARRYLDRLGAFAAGAAFASMGQVLELGRKGETEALYTFIVCASFLTWHAGAAQGPLRARTWMLGYAFAALGTLAKGTQAPVYFGGVALVYLVLRGRWRELLRPAHFAGIALYAAIVLLWLGPFAARVGLEDTCTMFTADVGKRFEDKSSLDALAHLSTFPLEYFACVLPWSMLLLAYASPALRRELGPFRDAAFFAVVVIAVTFPTVWFPPGGKTRYLMPIHPSVALLAGAVVQHSVRASAASWARTWLFLQRAAAVLAGVLAIGLWSVPVFAPAGSALAQPIAFALPAGAFALVCGALAWRGSRLAGERPAFASLTAIASLAGLVTTGVLVNVQRNTSNDLRAQVEELRARLPKGARVASLGWVSPHFVHYWGEPVPMLPWWDGPLDAPPDTDYFLFDPDYTRRTLDELQFRWEPVMVVSCDFARRAQVRDPVYVGRVLPPP